jgi:hypothetical protein
LDPARTQEVIDRKDECATGGGGTIGRSLFFAGHVDGLASFSAAFVVSASAKKNNHRPGASIVRSQPFWSLKGWSRDVYSGPN